MKGTQNMPAEELCRKYALYVPTHGKRHGSGRLMRTREGCYLTYVQKLLGEGDQRSKAIAALAADQQSQMRLVVDCTAAKG